MANNELDLTYLYDCQKRRYAEAWTRGLPVRTCPESVTIKNGYVLPPLPSKRMCGDGGVADAGLNPVSESFMYVDKEPALMGLEKGGMAGLVKPPVEYIDEECVYLGYIFNHWGNFLVDFTTRLHAACRHPGKKFIYLVSHGCQDFQPIPPIRRFLELLELDIGNFLFIGSPCQVKELVVPGQSYVRHGHVSEEYAAMFKLVCKNARKSGLEYPDKIYLSRTGFNEIWHKELGNELLDDLFQRQGYALIRMEDHSLDEQINYLRHAGHIACMSGTLAHNLLFCMGLSQNISIINKTYSINMCLFESLHIAGITPLFLDFYICKYPVAHGIGPFVLAFNAIMQKYARDRSLDTARANVYSEKYLAGCIENYNFLYANINRHRACAIQPANRNGSIWYLPPELQLDWMRLYAKYEQISIYEKFASCAALRANEHAWEATLDAVMAGRPLVIARVCMTRLGWLEKTASPAVAGRLLQPCGVSAICLWLCNEPFSIMYKVYYPDSGWSKEARDGEICGGGM